MKLARIVSATLIALALPALFLLANNARHAFGFNAPLISGFPGRSAEMTGGGAYLLPSFAQSAGGFRCLSDISGGPFTGCLQGQGVRWDTSDLLASTPFKCTADASEALKTAATDEHTVVLLADFYRQGDGVEESFTARMIVSDSDIAPDVSGTQNVWIQGIGCGEAVVHFN